jgi:cell wall assembly regulator SMI1
MIIRAQTELDEPFNEGCAEHQLVQLEAALQVSLPEDYKLLLSCTNGQREAGWRPLTFPPGGLTFMSAEEVVAEWREQANHYDDDTDEELAAHEKTRLVMFHPRKIPIAVNIDTTTYLFIDYAPGPGGQVGQLVLDADEVVENSFSDLLRRYVVALDSGTMRLERKPQEYGGGYWFTIAGRPVDLDLYRTLRLMD